MIVWSFSHTNLSQYGFMTGRSNSSVTRQYISKKLVHLSKVDVIYTDFSQVAQSTQRIIRFSWISLVTSVLFPQHWNDLTFILMNACFMLSTMRILYVNIVSRKDQIWVPLLIFPKYIGLSCSGICRWFKIFSEIKFLINYQLNSDTAATW